MADGGWQNNSETGRVGLVFMIADTFGSIRHPKVSVIMEAALAERPDRHDHELGRAGTACGGHGGWRARRVAGTAFSVDHARTPRATAPRGLGEERHG